MSKGERGEELLARGLAELGLERPGLDEILNRYVRELELWNPKLGLVDASGEELVIRHVLDCLAAVPRLEALLDVGEVKPTQMGRSNEAESEQGLSTTARSELRGPERGASRTRRPELRPPEQGAPRTGGMDDGAPSPAYLPACDLGSGAGLPGIPVTLAISELSMNLVERSGRRVGFLRNAVALLGCDRLTVSQEDAERLEGRYQLILARAWKPLTVATCEVIRRLVTRDGIAALYKGTRARIDYELETAGIQHAELYPLRVPFLDEERHLVVLRGNTVVADNGLESSPTGGW